MFDGLKKKEGRWKIESLVYLRRHCSSHVRGFEDEESLRFHVRDVHRWDPKKQAFEIYVWGVRGLFGSRPGICGSLITRTSLLLLLTAKVKRCLGSSWPIARLLDIVVSFGESASHQMTFQL